MVVEQTCTAILILNYNSADDTMNCIRSIEAHNTAPVKFIVVDNGSTAAAETDRLERFFADSGEGCLRLSDNDAPVKSLPRYTLIASPKNDGYARGNNKGLRFAGEDPSIQNILILNSDILFTEDLIPTLLSIQQEKADCALVTPLILSRYGRADHCCARKAPTNWEVILPFLLLRRNWFHVLSNMDRHQKLLLDHPELAEQRVFPVDVPSGACMLIDKALFREIGYFDPDTFLYYEENILYKKLQTRSRTSYCTPLVKCTHLGAVSTQQMSTVFLKQCNLESADIYLSRYSRLTFTQRLAWKIAKKMWTVKLNRAAARQTN